MIGGGSNGARISAGGVSGGRTMRSTTSAAPSPPSLTLLSPSMAARRPVLLLRARAGSLVSGVGRRTAAVASAAAGLPYPTSDNNNNNNNKPLPFLETVWRTIAAGGDPAGAAAPADPASAAAAAAAMAPREAAPLPPPPRDASFAQTMPYLASLALSERQMWWRVAAAFCLLFISKAAGLSCPLFLKRAVDALSAAGSTATATATTDAALSTAAATLLGVSAVLAPAVQAVLCFGACSMLQHLAKELQHPTFTPVSQAVSRRVAYHCFAHVLDLDIRFAQW